MSGSLAPADPPLPVNVMLRYGVGQTGAQIFRDTPAALLPVYLTTVLGVSPWLAGVAILLPKLWLIFCDPLMGAWSDRKAATWGRTPFLAGGAIATSLGFLALFNIPQFDSSYVAAALVSLIFLLSMTAFSAFSVPYLGIAASLSTDTHERTKILIYRMIFVSLGVMLGVGVAQPVVYWFGGGQPGWGAMAFIFGFICLVTMLGTALGLHPVLKAKQKESAPLPSLKTQFAAAARNRPFLLLTIIHFIQIVGQASSYTVVAMVFIYLVGNVDLLFPFVLVMSIFGLATQPLWLWISRRLGKLGLFVWLCVAWCGVTVTWLAIDWGADLPVWLPLLGESSVKELMILLRGLVIGVTNAGFLLLITSLFTDTVYLGEADAGASVEGGYAGLWSAAEKLGFAVGPLVAGIVLSLYGFEASRGGLIEQDAGALTGILMNYSLVPIAFFLASLFLVPALSRAMKAAVAARADDPAIR